MNKFLLHALFIALSAISIASCNSDSEDFDPFSQQTKGEFHPKIISFSKTSDNIDITETWSNIVRNSQDKVVSYDYTREVTGEFTEKESRSCKIDYFKDHFGNNAIRTETNVEYYKLSKGIEEKYTEKISETIDLNEKGYIANISTTTDHFSNNTTAPVITTSSRSFSYNGDMCSGSIYTDNSSRVTYRYNWSAYQLKGVTILNENSRNNTVDYNTYDYTYDTKEFYKYSGMEILPFVQSGLPQIFAAMGYLGKCTPYILTDEVQGGYTKFGNIKSENPVVRNSYSFSGDIDSKMMYSGISNIYNTYSVTYSK